MDNEYIEIVRLVLRFESNYLKSFMMSAYDVVNDSTPSSSNHAWRGRYYSHVERVLHQQEMLQYLISVILKTHFGKTAPDQSATQAGSTAQANGGQSTDISPYNDICHLFEIAGLSLNKSSELLDQVFTTIDFSGDEDVVVQKIRLAHMAKDKN